MKTMHSDSLLQQLVGRTPEPHVFVRAPKMPIGAVGNPHFSDFTDPKDSRETKTHHLVRIIRQIRQASSEVDFNGKLNLRMNKRFRQIHTDGFSCATPCFSQPRIGKPKAIIPGCAHGLPLWGLRWGVFLISFPGPLFGSGFTRYAFEKSESVRNWFRRYVAIESTDRKIPIALFDRFANFDIPVENAEWNSEPKHYEAD